MRTLKKSLCLVLALVMVLGLFVMGTNAAYTPYGDEADVNYIEAVQVLTGLGVIEGRTDGNFDPKATVTRAEACAMITRMVLGREAADKLPVGDVKFSDVSLESWEGRMAKYIAFCANRGIVVGMGDGTFHPTEPVTGTQLATMLLRALGRGVMGEYEGKGWDINAVADALYYKVFEDSKVTDFSQAASREETALYVFNALWADRVAWDVDINDYVYLLGTFGSEVYDLERLEKVQVMANQATGDPYTVIRQGTKVEKVVEVEVSTTVDVVDKDGKPTGEKKTEKTVEKRTETVDEYEYFNLDYETGLDLIAHQVTVYRNIGKEYKDKDNNKFWKTYLIQDKSETILLGPSYAAAWKTLRDKNRENVNKDSTWAQLANVQNWLNYELFSETGGLTCEFETADKLKGWETKSFGYGFGAYVVLDSESHLLACLNTFYHVDQVKKIVGDEIYLRNNDFKATWDTYDLALAYEGIAKGDYVTVQPVGKLCYLKETSTVEVSVTERGVNADYESMFRSPTFNDRTINAGMGWGDVNPPDTIDVWEVQAGDKVLFYMDAYNGYFAAKLLERGTLDGVVFVNYVYVKSGEGDYGDDDIVVYAQCVNEKGEEVNYKLDKAGYKDVVEAAADADAAKEAALTKMESKVGKVFKAYLDKKGFATLAESKSDLGNNLEKLEDKTTYLTRDGGTYYVTKDTKIYYVNGTKADMKITKASTLPTENSYLVCAQFTSNGTSWNTTVIWIKDKKAPKAADHYIYAAGSDTKLSDGTTLSLLENTGTELVDGKKAYYFGVYNDGDKPDYKVFVDLIETKDYIVTDGKHVYLKSGFYIYNEEEIDGKKVFSMEKLDPAEENPDIKVMDNVVLENGDVDGNRWFYEANGEKVDVKVKVLSRSACKSYDGMRYLSFTDIEDLGFFLNDTVGNNVTVSYLATKVGKNYVPFGTIYIISAEEKAP